MYKQELLLILLHYIRFLAVFAKSAKENLRIIANVGFTAITLFFIFRIASAQFQTGAMLISHNVGRLRALYREGVQQYWKAPNLLRGRKLDGMKACGDAHSKYNSTLINI
jgi:hypothetical protein